MQFYIQLPLKKSFRTHTYVLDFAEISRRDFMQ